ncbi:MAG: O-methyltransferase [Candidatus Heimdallarchaeota archaeon]|nr:MAG: O-methyltransferase [Candidatus Heimdallarchaeota archaeon]
MGILMDGLHGYMLDLVEERDPVLLEMESYAKEQEFPIIGALVGRLLSHYTQLIDAKRILELGSGYGYSAIYFSKAASDDAEIICTDTSEENKSMAISYFQRLAITNVKFIVGDGLEVINQLKGDFDIIYNDVDKEQYPQAFKVAVPRLRKGGLLITDNTLWYGRVLEATPKRESTKGVLEYNRLAFSDERVYSIINPIRDGVCVSIKL